MRTEKWDGDMEQYIFPVILRPKIVKPENSVNQEASISGEQSMPVK